MTDCGGGGSVATPRLRLTPASRCPLASPKCAGVLGFTGIYEVLLGLTGFYEVLLGFTEFYEVLLGFTGFYWVFQGVTRY